MYRMRYKRNLLRQESLGTSKDVPKDSGDW
jgi:hypothetical protein